MDNKSSHFGSPASSSRAANISEFYSLLNKDLDCLASAPQSQWEAAAVRLKILAAAMWLVLSDSGLGPVELGCLRKINSLNSVLISSGFPPFSISEVAEQEHQKVQQVIQQILIC